MRPLLQITDEHRAEAQRLIGMGYRRTSNKYLMVSRIDRPDWVTVLAQHLKRSPAELYEIGAPSPAARWCGFYRSVLSKDSLEGIAPEVHALIPHSAFDDVGYTGEPEAPDPYVWHDPWALLKSAQET